MFGDIKRNIFRIFFGRHLRLFEIIFNQFLHILFLNFDFLELLFQQFLGFVGLFLDCVDSCPKILVIILQLLHLNIEDMIKFGGLILKFGYKLTLVVGVRVRMRSGLRSVAVKPRFGTNLALFLSLELLVLINL